ncbi:NAD(P)/FAD-dependent oxidoreductase [Dyadobacter luticola]|uniref:NAD(P)/FAD-dependent oxidoreductase n=1 Tax=Dyadobacter luticola TaxID=1979387 RepID=A0A5R9L2W4_9BACT|nr:NAD(P)/FAD-dependent oxidoreductase [Dyadobacter luticola]TLV02761.1 NAD(P)/FAD-dependent oxidoreductase [Dyadobacter luticola]
MKNDSPFEVIIVGGSYAGLSAALALGRALRNVFIIDSGDPCNKQTPHSHNFLTRDGETPAAIAEAALKQVLAYPTVTILKDKVTQVTGTNNDFTVETESGNRAKAQKILFATGVRDIMPPIPGFAECWGISVIHCPYCHGYEYRGQKTGILANGETVLEMGKLIRHWTEDVTIFTNGAATFDQDTRENSLAMNIVINEHEIQSIRHDRGYLSQLNFTNNTSEQLTALYARPAFVQHCTIPLELGCEINEKGHLKVDEMQKTNIPGIYAAGDNTIMFRGISMVTAAGTKAGAMMNFELIHEG